MAPDGSDRVRAQPKILSYVLDIPNLCSLSGLACTVLALYFILRGHFDAAMIGMVWAVAFDWADGLIARRLKNRTGDDRQFGGQLDVLIDIVSYGVGPAVLTAFLISFFPIMVNIATGLATLEPELEDVLRVLGAKRWDVLVKVGLPRSMPYFFGSLKVAITLAFVGTTVSEMTASNEGIGYLLISAGSAMQMGLAFAGLVVVGAMAMVMYELFDYIERHTTGWAHRGSQNT